MIANFNLVNQHSKISEAGTQKEDHTPSKIVSVLDIDIAKEKDKRDFGTNYTEQDIK